MLTETHRLPTIAKGALALLVAISLLGVLFLLVLRPAGQQLGCQQTLRYTWYPLFADYSGKDPDGKYPPLSGVPGVFAPEYNAVKPVIPEENGMQYFCPTAHKSHDTLSVEAQLLHPTYAYFGYAFQNESELLAFLEAYPGFIEGGANFNNDLPAPEGQGSFGGDVFLRLRREAPNNKENITANSLFVLMELPHPMDETRLPHRGNAGHIMHASGAMKSIAYGAEAPMTPAVLTRINALRLKYGSATPAPLLSSPP